MANFLYFFLLFPAYVFAIGLEVSVKEPRCFEAGECKESYLLETSYVNDEFECLEACKRDFNCEWFTHFSHSGNCLLFSNCLDFDNSNCPTCVSGRRDCTIPAPVCWVTGECEGNVIVNLEISSEKDCLNQCKSAFGCRWFTFEFHQPYSNCILYRDCNFIDQTCDFCNSGEQRCNIGQDTTTYSTPIPTTAAPTTAAPTTARPTTAAPTTARPTTAAPTTARPTTAAPTTAAPTTARPTTAAPTTTAPTTTINFTTTTEYFEVYLLGGSGPYEGNVFAINDHTGVSGPICDHEFGLENAIVICRQLGFRNVQSIHFGSVFGQVSLPYSYDHLNCQGSEFKISDCPYENLGQGHCDASEAAGVTCE